MDEVMVMLLFTFLGIWIGLTNPWRKQKGGNYYGDVHIRFNSGFLLRFMGNKLFDLIRYREKYTCYYEIYKKEET